MLFGYFFLLILNVFFIMVQEGFLLSELSHPNIVNFRNFYFDKNNAYIIMDYADGGDLDIKIKEQLK